MNDLLNTILKDTYTQSTLNHRLNILKSFLLDNLFGNTQKQTLEPTDSAWLETLPAPFFKNFNKDNVYSIFNQLDLQKRGLKVLTMYLAFEPDMEAVNLIGEASRKAFGQSLILDIKYDPKLIAGAALVWKGIFKDYSLHSQIETKKTEILASFKRYLR